VKREAAGCSKMVVSTRLKGVTSKKIMLILLENKNNTGGRTHTD